VGYLFILKEKIRRIGGCKGRLSRVYLTVVQNIDILLYSGFVADDVVVFLLGGVVTFTLLK
jgi:hypothetical protein